ncbi:hypothetical protein C808_02540 [Lachnospiraceae bacterium M18-1]|nr:hypothetical protein C808_02540 [Lachnospiraceae bacterium M18-1]
MIEYYIPTGYSETELVERRSRFISQIRSVECYSDDGELQGTVRKPMLNVCQRENVTNVVCVVSRYSDGIPLGTGDLVRGCAPECVCL